MNGSRRAAEAGISRRSIVAMTILEVLVVLFVVSALLAVLLPAVARTSGRAAELQSIALLRDHGAVMAMYAIDFADALPCPVPPSSKEAVLYADSRYVVRSRYLDVSFKWNFALAGRYYNGDPFQNSFASPWQPSGGSFFTEFFYTTTALADPGFFSSAGRVGSQQFRSIRIAEAVFPSAKGLLLDRASLFQHGVTGSASPRVSSAFFDGSAGAYDPAEYSPPFWGFPIRDAGTETLPYPVVHTPNGVRGRDIVLR